ncbi:hypothetical protein DH2020_014550 [Rehmannia glutinosa]|uniref:DNA 3'-5' helicase n=1 Tax=Rehmannia glutinosa TaxID=99300 RepID=A0ABR0X0E2_REHGL
MSKSPLPLQSVSGAEKQVIKKEALVKILRWHFGYSDFRGKQLEAIQAVLSGRDCFCLMPTGGGKSMCYQIPALAKQGIVLVVSPLIGEYEQSLLNYDIVKDYAAQVPLSCKFQEKNLMASTAIFFWFQPLCSGKPSLRLLYVTPELIATSGFMAKLIKIHDRGLLNLIAIDEVRSYMGFNSICECLLPEASKPSYRKLSSLRNRLPSIPVLALTATAVLKVQEDVIDSLCLRNPLVLKSSFNRPNIYYEVRYKDLLDDPYSDLCNYLKSYGNNCAIVYCLERTACDDLAVHLSKNGISCAGLNSKLRSSVLDNWISSKTQVVVATVAFGALISRGGARGGFRGGPRRGSRGGNRRTGRADLSWFSHLRVLLRWSVFIVMNLGHTKYNCPQLAPRTEKGSSPHRLFLRYGHDFEEWGSVVQRVGVVLSLICVGFGIAAEAILLLAQLFKWSFYCRMGIDRKDVRVVCHFNIPKSMEGFYQESGRAGRDQLPSRSLLYYGVDDRKKMEFILSNAASKKSLPSSLEECSSKKSLADFRQMIEYCEESGCEGKRSLKVLEKSASALNDEDNSQNSGIVMMKQVDLRKIYLILMMSKADKNSISETLRESGKQRLLNAMKQNQHRFSNLQIDFVTSAETLENECHKKYEKSGKSFYLSQMASTVRWLSTATPDELTDRLGKTANISSEAVRPEANFSSPSSSSFNPVITQVDEQKVTGGSVKSSSPVSQDTLPPPILSFSEFVNRRKATDNQFSTSKRPSSDGVTRVMEKKTKF